MMFTPPNKKKPQTDWSLTPHRSGGGGSLGLVSPKPRIGDRGAEKGKAVAFAEPVSPHKKSDDAEAADWRKFKEVGFLDKSLMEKQDREALVQKIEKLEKELHDYQFNMGLLLIEKQEWASTYEELRQAYSEAQETLKREQIAHLMVLSEVEKREANLRKALQNEKQCATDSEKAFNLISAGSEEMKLNSDRKVAEAHALVTNVEDRSLVVEAKLHAVDAKLAEVSRKGSQIERKLKETETYEHLLLADRHSFDAEKEMVGVTFSKQREELQNWDNSLKEREERQLEGREILKQVEERTRDNYRRVEQKEMDLKEAQRKIEILTLKMKNSEEDMKTRLASFAKKEEEVQSVLKNLERKEKELHALEEKLIAREGVEIQKLYDEHNAILDLRKQEFELEMERKRKDVDGELRNRVTVLELKEVQVVQKEETLDKREQGLENKLDNYEKQERDLERKREALKEKEKFLQAEEKRLETERDHMLTDKEKLNLFDSELEKKRADIDDKQTQLHKELENLKVTEEERIEIQRLQSELRHKKEKCMLQEDFLIKEKEALKQVKKDYEREWEVLDEKKIEITGMLNQINEEKERLEKLKLSNEERLKNENLIAQEYIQKELEALRSKKASFEASMERDRKEFSRKTESERQQMLHDLELRKTQLEHDMHNKLDKLENNLLEKDKALKEQIKLESENINQSTEVAGGTMKRLGLERLRIEKDTQELATSKQRLEEQQIELRKGIDKLNVLVKKLKDQSKGFKEIFVNRKKCKNCGEHITGYLQFLQDMENIEAFSLPRLFEGCISAGMTGNSLVSIERLDEASSFAGCSTSVLVKCTTQGQARESSLSDEKLNGLKGNIRDSEPQLNPSDTEPFSGDSKALEIPEGSLHKELKTDLEKPGINPRRGGRRANSLKAGVEEAKLKHSKPSKSDEGKQPSEITDGSAGIIEGCQEVSLGGDERPAPDNSEAHAVIVATRSRRANSGKESSEDAKDDQKPVEGMQPSETTDIIEDAKAKRGRPPKPVASKQPSEIKDVSTDILERPEPDGRKKSRSSNSEKATSVQDLDNKEAPPVSKIATKRGRRGNSGNASGITDVPPTDITENNQELSLGGDEKPAAPENATNEQDLDNKDAHPVSKIARKRGRRGNSGKASGITDVPATDNTEDSQEVFLGGDERPAPENGTGEQNLDNKEAHLVSKITTKRGRRGNSGKASGIIDVPATDITEESQEVSLGGEERPAPENATEQDLDAEAHTVNVPTRKSRRGNSGKVIKPVEDKQPSGISDVPDDSEEVSLGVATRRGRKRGQTDNLGSETPPEGKRHNLRRRKT